MATLPLTARFFANGVDLAKCLVTQNDRGEYWLKNGALARFILSEFDKPHAGYSKKSDGSHVPYIASEHPIDFSLAGGTKLTSNKSLKLITLLYIKGYKVPYGQVWVYGNHHFITDHTKTTCKVGAYAPAGSVFATVMTPAENLASGRFSVENGVKVGFPSHLHFGTDGGGNLDDTTVRQFILAPVVPATVPPVVTPPVEPPPVITPPPPTPVDPKDAEIEQLKKDKQTLSDMVKDRNTKITGLEADKGKVLADVDKLSTLIQNSAYGKPVEGKPPTVFYDIAEDWDLQQYKYIGALAEIKNQAFFNSTVGELIQAIINKFITKRA